LRPCSLANLHRNPINKDATPHSTLPGERIFIDISKLTQPSIKNSKFWLIVIDDATDFTWSYFLTKKSDTTSKLLHIITDMQNNNTPVRRIRCNNAGENQSLQTTAHNKGIQLVFEYTSPGTPQQNRRAESYFAVLYHYMRRMLKKASLSPNLRTKLGLRQPTMLPTS
jgi:hypothetical protein